jgi:hypothetical protein
MARVKAALFGDVKGRVEHRAKGFGKADGLHNRDSLWCPILPELGVPVSPANRAPESRFAAFLNIGL